MPHGVRCRRFGWVGIAVALAAASALAGTFYVAETGDDGNDGLTWETALRTLQAAVSKCSDAVDDLIWVSNGVYTTPLTGTNVVMVNKSRVTFQSVNGKDVTFIDGGYPDRSNRCIRIASHNVVFRGFTIRNGCIYYDASSPTDSGSAILLRGGTNALFESCAIISNVAQVAGGSFYGGAVRDWNDALSYIGRLRFRECEVAHNWYELYGSGYVYGVVNRVRVENCIVRHNLSHRYGVLYECSAYDSVIVSNVTVDSGFSGGGIRIQSGGTYTAEVVNCLIGWNKANSTSGGGISLGYGTGIVQNCLIAGNQASGGGGVSVENDARACLYVENCTIVANQSLGDYNGIGTAGGGIVKATANGQVFLYNTIIWSNRCNHPNNAFMANLDPRHITNIFYSCSTTNAAGGGSLPGANNITDPPLFVSGGSGYGTNWTGGDLSLAKGSPCINTGTNLAWTLLPGAKDLAGKPRISGGTVDMGCYEYTPPPAVGTVVVVR